MRVALAVIVVLASAAPAARAENAHLARARQELDKLEYEEARASLDQALRQGDSGPADLVEIYRLSGQVAASLGDTAAAEASFVKALSIDGSVALPAGTSPKIAGPFEAARARAGVPIRVRHEVASESPFVVALVVEADPQRMVTGGRVTFWREGQPESSVAAPGTDRIEVQVPARPPVDFYLAAIDPYGNRLVEIGSRAQPLALAGAAGVPPAQAGGGKRSGRALYARWWLWGGVAVACAGLGTYFGLAALDAQDELDALNADSMNHDFSEAKAVEDRGRRDALIANISFGAAGAFGVVAAILIVTDLGKPAARERAQAAPLVVPGGAGVVISGTLDW